MSTFDPSNPQPQPPPPAGPPLGQVPPPQGYAAYPRFYVNTMGTTHGPYEFPQLQGLVRVGQVKSETPVSDDRGGGWFPARDLPGLFSQKEGLVTPPPSIFLGGLGARPLSLRQGGPGL